MSASASSKVSVYDSTLREWAKMNITGESRQKPTPDQQKNKGQEQESQHRRWSPVVWGDIAAFLTLLPLSKQS